MVTVKPAAAVVQAAVAVLVQATAAVGSRDWEITAVMAQHHQAAVVVVLVRLVLTVQELLVEPVVMD